MVVCRRARQEDLEACFVLKGEKGIFQHYFQQEHAFEKVIQNAFANANLYVAVWKTKEAEEGDIAGLMIIKKKAFCDLYDYLSLLCVGEKFRGKGVGSALLKDFENIGGKDRCRKLALLVSDFNTSAQTFYKSHGYYEAGRIPGCTINTIDELLFLKDI